MTYELSVNKKCHNRDLRCLDYYQGVLVTGSADKTLKIYSTKGQTIQQITTVTIFQKNVLSVRINRKGGSQVFILAGCGDGKIYGLDHSGNPIMLIEHDSPISSLNFINSQHFVSGSWDGKAIVWHIAARKKISQYTNHKHAVAVYYNQLTDEVVSGSQDKALAVWSWQDGKQKKRKEGAHNDIIRQISGVTQVGFITCSNDETLKLWTSQLEEISHFTGAHSAFIFTVKSLGFGKYFSGGDDKSIKIWENETVVQTLQCPASIWSIALEETGEVYAGCSDGYLRVFSTDPNKKAPLKVIEAFNKQILDSAAKKSGMSSQQISKLPTLAEMMSIKGKKVGQIRVSRNGLIPQAFMWQNNKWEKIGQVITENNQGNAGMTQSRYYPGDKYFEAGDYDYIFDVDDESGMHKQIPYNDGANALEAAEKYCMREGLSKGYIEQIRKFLMANSSNIPRKQLKAATQKQVPQSSLKSTPQCIPIEYPDIKNPTAVMKKITQFNELVSGQHKLTDRQLEHCTRIATLLENSKNYHSWKLDFKQIDTIKKLLQWPSQYKLPVWDIFRAFLCHYQSEAFFSGLDAGFDIVAQLSHSLEKQNSQGYYGLVFRTLTNVMIQNTNKNGIVKCVDILFNSVQNFSKRSDLKNKNLLAAVAGFLFNFSVTVFQKKIENEQIISQYAKILSRRLEIDDEEQNRGIMLQAAGNIIFKYQSKRDQFMFVKKYLGNNEISQDLKLFLA